MDKLQCKNNLRDILEAKGLTNKWIANEMGVSEMTVSRWSTNKVQPPMAQFLRLSILLDVELKDLVKADKDNRT